ncbi:outer membrane efflux NodT family protein (plasmid) [Rhizobium sp. NXC24]|nr:outer membrane efflux NodT family protein [Rhizobium sp. NXC24]
MPRRVACELDKVLDGSGPRQATKSYQEDLDLSTISYKDGASSLLNVLDAQRSILNAQESLAEAVQQSALD